MPLPPRRKDPHVEEGRRQQCVPAWAVVLAGASELCGVARTAHKGDVSLADCTCLFAERKEVQSEWRSWTTSAGPRRCTLFSHSPSRRVFAGSATNSPPSSAIFRPLHATPIPCCTCTGLRWLIRAIDSQYKVLNARIAVEAAEQKAEAEAEKARKRTPFPSPSPVQVRTRQRGVHPYTRSAHSRAAGGSRNTPRLFAKPNRRRLWPTDTR